MDNKSTTKRMIGAVVLVLIAALLLAWLLKGKNQSVQEQQELIAQQTQDATPILGFPGVKEGGEEAAQNTQEGDAPYVIGGTDAQQQNDADAAQQNTDQTAQQAADAGAADDKGTGVGATVAGAAAAGKEAVQNLADNFQVRDTDGKQRQVVGDGEVKAGTGSMGSSEIAIPKQAGAKTDAGGDAADQSQSQSAEQTQAAAGSDTEKAEQADAGADKGAAQSAAPQKQAAANPKLVDEKPVPAPRVQTSAPAQTETAAVSSSSSAGSSSSSAGQSQAVGGQGYAIQVLAASSRNKAEQVRQSIAVDGYPVFVVKANVNGKTVYRVRVGTYPARNAARAVQSQMKARYSKNQYVQNSFVTKN